MGERIFGFEPVFRADARLLILGSMPSVESLHQSFYYAHPRNAFWRMLSEILGQPLPASIEEKKEMLISHRIALWDTVRSCERAGSLDSAIRSAEANDFEALFEACPNIRTMLFNGAAAQALFRRLVGAEPKGLTVRRMPSTSPAYTLNFNAKRDAWERAIKEALSNEPL